MVTMYMPLRNKGTAEWRPVEVKPLGGVYLVEGPMPADEEWEFTPGTVVDCKWKRFGDERRLVPTGQAFPTIGQRLLKAAIFIGVVMVSAAPFSTDLNWIVPPSPYTAPYMAAWAAASGAAYYRWRDVQLVRQMAGTFALFFGVLAVIALFI